MVLLGQGWAGGLEWPEAVELARKPADKRSMSYRQMIAPLEKRGLVEVARESKYIPETKDFIPKLLALTPLGLALRHHLERKQG